MRPQTEEKAAHWGRRLACHLQQLLSWHLFPVSMGAECTIGHVSWRARKGGPISLSSHIPRHYWQGSGGTLPSLKVVLGGWIPTTLGSVSDPPTVPFSASHWSLTHFPNIFWFSLYFFSYCHIAKVILPFLFLSVFLVPICHRWKRNTNVILPTQLSSPSNGWAVSVKVTHKINWGLHCVQRGGTVKPKGTWYLLCPTCLHVRLWAAAQCQHILAPPWAICVHEV